MISAPGQKSGKYSAKICWKFAANIVSGNQQISRRCQQRPQSGKSPVPCRASQAGSRREGSSETSHRDRRSGVQRRRRRPVSHPSRSRRKWSTVDETRVRRSGTNAKHFFGCNYLIPRDIYYSLMYLNMIWGRIKNKTVTQTMYYAIIVSQRNKVSLNGLHLANWHCAHAVGCRPKMEKLNYWSLVNFLLQSQNSLTYYRHQTAWGRCRYRNIVNFTKNSAVQFVRYVIRILLVLNNMELTSKHLSLKQWINVGNILSVQSIIVMQIQWNFAGIYQAGKAKM